MKWFVAHFKKDDGHHIKPTVVSEQLLAYLIADMEARGCHFAHKEEMRCGGWDMPGPVFMNRPMEETIIDGLRFVVPSSQIALFLFNLSDMPLRQFAEGYSYHKLHSWASCIVFSPEQVALFKAWAESIKDEADKKAEAFYNELEKGA